jgi:predicted transcriptional regulator
LDPLELDTRRRIYEHVARHPGKYLRELQRELGLAMGALEYHLDQLAAAHLVSVAHEAQKRFFPTDMDRRDKPVLAFLRQKLPRRALLLVLRDGACPKARMLVELDLAPSTLNYHLRRLVDFGLLQADREGRDAVYRVTDAPRVVALLVAHRASLMDRMVDAFLEGMDAMR